MADRLSPFDKKTNSNEEEIFRISQLINSSDTNYCVVKNKGRKILQNKSIMSNARKPKFNYDDLKNLKVNITHMPPMKTFVIDRLDGVCSVQDSGSFFKREEFSECKIIHSCDEVNKSSISKYKDEEMFSANEEQKTKERIIRNDESTGESEQNLSALENKGNEIVRNECKTSQNVIKSKYNSNHLKDIIVKIICTPKKKLYADPQTADTFVHMSGTLVNREESSEYEIIDKPKEIDKNSVAEYKDKESCSVDKEQRTKEIDVKSSAGIKQSLSGAGRKEKELVLNESSIRSPFLNADDIKQITADLSRNHKKNLLLDKVIAAPISKHNSGPSVQREHPLKSKSIENYKEAGTSSITEFEDREMICDDEEQRIRSRSPESSEQNLSALENKGKEIVQNIIKSKCNSNDPKDIKIICTYKKKLFADPETADTFVHKSGTLVNSEESSEYDIIDKSEEIEKSSIAEYEDKECSVDKEERTKNIDVKSSVGIEQSFSRVVSKDKEFGLNKLSTRSQDVKPVFNADDIKKIIADLSRKRKKNLSVDKAIAVSTSKHNSGPLVQREQTLECKSIENYKEARNSSTMEFEDKEMCSVDEEQRIRSRSPKSTEQNLSGAISKKKEFVQNELSTRSQDVHVLPSFKADDIKQIIADLSQNRKKNLSVDKVLVIPISKHVDEEQRIWSRSPESTEQNLRKLRSRRRVYDHFKRRPKRSNSGSRSASGHYSRSLFRRRRHRYSSSSSDDGYNYRNRPRSRSRTPIRHRHGRHAHWTDSRKDERLNKTLEPKKVTNFKIPSHGCPFGHGPFPPTGFISPRVREPPISLNGPFPSSRIARPYPSPAATGGSQSSVLRPSRVTFPPPVPTWSNQSRVNHLPRIAGLFAPSRATRPFPSPAATWGNQSGHLPPSGIERPFLPPAASGGNQFGILPPSRAARPFTSQAATWGNQSGDLPPSGVKRSFPPPTASGGNQSGILPPSRAARPFPSPATTWGNHSVDLPPSRAARPFPVPVATWGNQSGDLPPSGVEIPFPPPAASGGNQSGVSSLSRAARPFPLQQLI